MGTAASPRSRIARAAARPSITGICMSMRIRSHSCCADSSSAIAPFSACSTTRPALDSSSRATSRLMMLSSASSTLWPPWCLRTRSSLTSRTIAESARVPPWRYSTRATTSCRADAVTGLSSTASTLKLAERSPASSSADEHSSTHGGMPSPISACRRASVGESSSQRVLESTSIRSYGRPCAIAASTRCTAASPLDCASTSMPIAVR